MILDQEDRDSAVQYLLKKLSKAYTFMNEDGRLAEIESMQELYGKVARQTSECADFIVHYSWTKGACESSALRCRRLILNVIFPQEKDLLRTCLKRLLP